MMKKINRIALVYVLVLGLIFLPIGTKVVAAEVNCNINVPVEAVQFVESSYVDMLNASVDYYDTMNKDEICEYRLGEPFIICDNNTKYQDEIYYFPVLDEDEIVIVISVMNTSNGWNISASDELIDVLNEDYNPEGINFCYIEDEELKIFDINEEKNSGGVKG